MASDDYDYKEEIKRRKEEQKLYAKLYYKTNKDKIKAKQKEYKEKNAEKLKEYSKKYIEKNRGKINAYHKDYYHRKIRRKRMTHAKIILNEIRERFEDLDDYIKIYEDSQTELEEKRFFLRELKKIVEEQEEANGSK